MKTTTSASMLLGLSAAALLTGSMFVAVPAQLGAARADGGMQAKLDAEVAALGLPELSRPGGTHFSDTDLTIGSDRRWAFPALRAAQLKTGEPLVFVLPGGTAIEMPLVDRTVIDGRTIHFTFTDAAAGNAAQVTVHAGTVRGLVHATIDGRRFSWSLASGVDANGLSGDYYADATGDAGTHEPIAPTGKQDDAAIARADGGEGGSADGGADGSADGSEGGIAGGSGCADSGQLIDVLVAVTPNFAALFATQADLTAAIAADVGYANSAMANSNAVPRFRVVGAVVLPDNGTGSLTTDLFQLIDPGDGWNDDVHIVRNDVRADLVTLYSDSATAGSAAIIGVAALDGADAFSTVGRTTSVEPFPSLARALGANLGCCTQEGATPACAGFYSFSKAWTYTIAGTVYQTVMASGDGSVIPFYSSPLVEWLGEPTGTATANNARTASLTANVVANYRCSSGGDIDCDNDGVPDQQAIQSGLVPDCNLTGIPDSCDIALGISLDVNLDGLPDECPLDDVEFSASGISSLDTLGAAVGISSATGDPETLAIIGAPGNDEGASNAGAAYLFTVQAGEPVPTALLRANDPLANAFFGRGATVFKRPASVTAPIYPARNFALVGAYRWTETATVGTFPSKGAVYLFAQEGAVWNQIWRYTPPATNTFQARENSLFGYSVAMGRHPREGADQIIVGAPGHTNGRGKVYLLRNYFPNGQTVERGGLLSTRAVISPVDGDNYGASVALEPYLPVLTTSRVIAVIGAPGRNASKGAAYVFDRGPGATTGIGTFPGTGLTLTPTGEAALVEGDRFGTAVAVAGNLVAIGAPGALAGKGVVHFWERSLTTIAAINSTYQYRGFFKAPDGVEGDALGSSLSIAPAATGTGFTVVIGAPKAAVTVPSGVRNGAGKVYVLHKTPGQTGAELLSIRASLNPATGDEFGYSATSTRGFSLIGAPFSDITGLNSGKARLLTTP